MDDLGEIIKNKTRLVAKGYNQEEGTDYDETYALVARLEAIRILLVVTSVMKLNLYQMDVKSTFLNGYIKEEVYVEQPPGFQDYEHPYYVFKLKKGSIWIETGTKVMEFSKTMQEEFEMSMMGELIYFLGLQVKQTDNGIFIHQSKYYNDLLKKYKMLDCKEAATPMTTNCYLDLDEAGKIVDQKMYRGMIGSLLYLTTSRLDIIHNVCLYARFQSQPKESHLTIVKRILKYLKGTKNLGLWYPSGSNIFLKGYSDYDFSGCKLDRKRTSGTCHLLGCSLVSWNSKKQACVALSTTEAEYIATGSCCAQSLWVKSQLEHYGISLDHIPLKCDNTVQLI
ncbi:uncharacterized mitochondrial protein AtMg00810-like [Vigna angularis]|uniref:uncharacterized mitochondrial protein AtMg00810-like n=1 Tax=Phaseolus angularis TaxID=3914 RepID=UPI0022B53200|nr:uncharacterized mitochondrial protein AtMg00810-like [Vigna angularis]